MVVAYVQKGCLYKILRHMGEIDAGNCVRVVMTTATKILLHTQSYTRKVTDQLGTRIQSCLVAVQKRIPGKGGLHCVFVYMLILFCFALP